MSAVPIRMKLAEYRHWVVFERHVVDHFSSGAEAVNVDTDASAVCFALSSHGLAVLVTATVDLLGWQCATTDFSNAFKCHNSLEYGGLVFDFDGKPGLY